MPRRTAKKERGAAARHRIVLGVLLLLPLLMVVGILAPAAIEVQEEEEEASAGWSGPLSLRPLSKRPLLVPRDFSAGFVPELVDIESLFVSAQYRAQDAQRISSLPSFPSAQGDTIVLDEVDAYVAEEVFDDALDPMLTVDLTPLWDPAVFDIVPPLIPTNGERQYDDFPGSDGPVLTSVPPTPVPEPGTAALLALGLAGLGLRARARA